MDKIQKLIQLRDKTKDIKLKEALQKKIDILKGDKIVLKDDIL